ncbi:helix-turn-helix domain-containing protein [Halobacteriovorax sp. GB3]|uniref:helix-turn-helix domain-containing protein n=1 Tax=Halobacteriovorax sp. GB3 TaxID=2719615 RepID=UPI0023626B79|nr:RodZ domain-containing protein [Halobacteriovorax sp. GB3]MDD0852612.1 helix-turn-helix domain-containing protein [Halobacteriovorax sp. GB3]
MTKKKNEGNIKTQTEVNNEVQGPVISPDESIEEVETNNLDENQSSDLPTIGEYLRTHREAKGYSIKVVAQHTKINVTNLEHLERNEFDKLPNIAYLKGFVRNYAKILNLDEKEAVDILCQSQGHIEKEVSTPTSKIENIDMNVDLSSKDDSRVPETSYNAPNKNTGAIYKLGGAIVLATLVAFLFFKASDENETNQVSSDTQQIQEVKDEIQEIVEESTPATAEEETVQAGTQELVQEETQEETDTKEPEVTKEVQEVAVETKTPEPVEEEKVEKKEKEEEQITLRPLPTPLYTFASPTDEELQELLPEKYKQSVVEGKQNLFINAFKGDSWITYKADDEPIKKFILKEGRQLLIRGDEIRIFFGNVHVTKIFLNNQLLDIKSSSGVKSLVFPEESVSKFKIPLFIFNKKTGEVSPSSDLEQGEN